MPPLTEANDIIRSRNVTASECYALLGRHPYTDPQRIYDRLTSPRDYGHPEQTEAMALGVFLEPYVARYAARKHGFKVRANLRSVEYPGPVNLCATPDYLILRQPYLMEVKVSGITYGWTEGDLHPHYEYQARAQMACTGRDAVLVVALVGSTFHSVWVTRDDEKEERLLTAVDEFMHNHVFAEVRPPAKDETLMAVVTAR